MHIGEYLIGEAVTSNHMSSQPHCADDHLCHILVKRLNLFEFPIDPLPITLGKEYYLFSELLEIR